MFCVFIFLPELQTVTLAGRLLYNCPSLKTLRCLQELKVPAVHFHELIFTTNYTLQISYLQMNIHAAETPALSFCFNYQQSSRNHICDYCNVGPSF